MDAARKELKAERRAAGRQCLITGEMLPKEELLRFVASPDLKDVVFDITERLPGKGMWIKADRNVLEKALSSSIFAKAMRRGGLKVGFGIDNVISLMKGHLFSALALSNKSGLAVAGFDAVQELLGQGGALVALVAKQASDESRRKVLLRLGSAQVLEMFDEGELGRVFSRDSVTFMALKPGKITHAFANEALKLEKIMVKEMDR